MGWGKVKSAFCESITTSSTHIPCITHSTIFMSTMCRKEIRFNRHVCTHQERKGFWTIKGSEMQSYVPVLDLRSSVVFVYRNPLFSILF